MGERHAGLAAGARSVGGRSLKTAKIGRPRKNPGEGADIRVHPKGSGFRARASIYDASGAKHDLEATAKTEAIAYAKVEAKIRDVWGTTLFDVGGDSTFEQIARDYLTEMELRPLDGDRALRESSREKYRLWIEKLIAQYGALRMVMTESAVMWGSFRRVHSPHARRRASDSARR